MPAKGTSVLIAENDDSVRELIRDRLNSAGLRTREARDGKRALLALHEHPFAALVLDINMPGISGFDVLKEKPSISDFPPVLMLTARHASADVQHAMALGAKDYLAKPFTGEELVRRVKRLLRSPRSRQVEAKPEVYI